MSDIALILLVIVWGSVLALEMYKRYWQREYRRADARLTRAIRERDSLAEAMRKRDT